MQLPIWIGRTIGLWSVFSLLLFVIFGAQIIDDINSPDRSPEDLLKGADLIKDILLSQVSFVSIILTIISNVLGEIFRLRGSRPGF